MISKKRIYLSFAFILALGVFIGLLVSSHMGIMSTLPAKTSISPKSVEILTQLSEAQSEVAAVEKTNNEYVVTLKKENFRSRLRHVKNLTAGI